MPTALDDRCPTPVHRASMTQRWDSLTFVHFEYEPSDIARLLPAPLRPDTFDGAAWVSLVPFEMQHVRLTGIPPLPGCHRFCETNVRTYVVAPDGTPAVFFFSLDVPTLPVVAFARAAFGLPYQWSTMSIDRRGRTIRYDCRRRRLWPRSTELAGTVAAGTMAASGMTVSIGDPVAPDDLDVFLTARWGLLTATGSAEAPRARYTPVEHDPWPLHAATVTELDDTLLAAAGLPEPDNRMIVRYSPGVDVRIGLPRRIAGPPARRPASGEGRAGTPRTGEEGGATLRS
ncbi:MAG: YqjF family protein [Acidimicrobiia bacterium]